MPFVDTREIVPFEKRPGWRGRIYHSESMTFAQWDFDPGAEIHEHQHLQEEVWHVLEGELAITVAGETRLVGPGSSASCRRTRRTRWWRARPAGPSSSTIRAGLSSWPASRLPSSPRREAPMRVRGIGNDRSFSPCGRRCQPKADG